MAYNCDASCLNYTCNGDKYLGLLLEYSLKEIVW